MTAKRTSKLPAKTTARRPAATRASRFMGIRIADPAVRPKSTTVQRIRKAVADTAAHPKT
jgi:uncharacterized RDD family membrane protein YckC